MHGRDRRGALFSWGLRGGSWGSAGGGERGGGGKAFEEGASVGEEGTTSIGGEDIVEDLSSGFGSIFLNLEMGEADGGASAERVDRAIGEDAEVEGLSVGAIAGGGELIGLGEACGGGEGVFREIAEELFVEAGGFPRIFLSRGLGGGFEQSEGGGGLAWVFLDEGGPSGGAGLGGEEEIGFGPSFFGF